MIYLQNVSYYAISNFNIDLSAYVFIVIVYIASLLYMKASTRMSAKNRYLRHKFPNKYNKKNLDILKLKKKIEDTNSTLKSIINAIFLQLKNPHLHLFVLRFLAFLWMYLYFCFQSIVPLAFLLHSVVYRSESWLIACLKFFYTPLLWLVFGFDYVINIKNMFDEGIYVYKNYRFGLYDYKPAFPHLLFQLFTCSYACFTLYMFRDYYEELALLAKAREDRRKRKAEKKAKILSQSVVKIRGSSNMSSFYSEDPKATLKKKKVFTYEIIIRFLLKNIDIALMVVIYIAGFNRADVYHCILLTLFAIYIMYPDQFRRNFIFLLYFMAVIACAK